MSGIIALLPLLLSASVILFFIGLTRGMWDVNRTVGSVVAGGMAIAGLFYGVSTLLSVVFVSAPFRTPLGRWIYSLLRLILLGLLSLAELLRVWSSPEWLKAHRSSYKGAKKREDIEVDKRSDLAMDALVWLANQLSISQDQDTYERSLLLTNELRKQDLTHFMPPDESWLKIFDLLGSKYLKTDPLEDISAEEMRTVAVLSHCYRIPVIEKLVCPKESMNYCWDKTRTTIGLNTVGLRNPCGHTPLRQLARTRYSYCFAIFLFR